MKDNFVVSEETENMVGMKIVDNGDCVILQDIDTIDGEENGYLIFKSDIPKLIKGLKLFMEK